MVTSRLSGFAGSLRRIFSAHFFIAWLLAAAIFFYVATFDAQAVNFVAYPSGLSTGFVQAAAKKAGYAGGVGTWYGKTPGAALNMTRIKIK